MRPLTLSLRGLRSYLTEAHIDFTTVGLVAIHGDTGAGKSSLLEALCFALYGGCTWDKRNATDLISDGVHTMQVRLTFRCVNRTWQVTRAISRSSSPPSRHELICLDAGTRYDTKQQVNAVIEKMIGLSHAAFLKAVILPQGRFQALLHTTKEDRTAILKGILGIDQLDAMQVKARAHHDRLRPLLDQLILDRRGLLDDPPATAAEATQRLGDALQRQDQLTTARAAVRDASTRRGQLLSRAASVEQQAQRLTRAREPGAAASLQALASLDEAIRAEQETCQAAITDWHEREQQLQDAVAAAEREGRGPSSLAKAIAVVDATRNQLPDIDAERERIQADAHKLGDDTTRADQHAASVTELAREAAEAEEAADAAAAIVKQARELVASHRSALGTARTLRGALHRAEADLTDACQRITDADSAIQTTTEEAGQAREKQTAAEEALNAVIRANAAAHAAATCHPGDPCPICSRDLPATFQPPLAQEEKDARKTLTVAKRLAAEADRRHHAAVTTRQHAVEEAERVQTRVDQGRGELDRVLADLASQLGTVDLDKPDDLVLAPLAVRLGAAERNLQAAQATARDVRQRATAAATALEHTRQALADRQATLTADRRRLDRRVRKTVGALGKLPAAWHLDPLTLDGLDQLMDTARRWEQELATTTGQLTTAQGQLQQLRERREALASRHLTEVERPATQLLHAVDGLTQHAADTAVLVGHGPPPSRPVEDDLHRLAAWAAALDDTVGALLQAAHDAATSARSDAELIAEEITQGLLAVDVDDAEQLDDLIVKVAAAAHVAQADLDRAKRETPIAADLDRRIKAATPFVEALRELGALLANGQFQAAVVARRQRAFLGLATDQMLAMTTGRFAFSDDFRIIDRYTSQPRDVRTLSGGETFLASLALALAVVDLAGRAGGRADALLLDEGFGSLDADTLAEALAALSRQTLGGRLVAVISHMRAVAESIGNVLIVTRDSTGSHAHWASESERSRLVDEDLDEGLLP
ncbi:SMC family ATPase [Actinomycetes bacterium KLBMP 9797]